MGFRTFSFTILAVMAVCLSSCRGDDCNVATTSEDCHLRTLQYASNCVFKNGQCITDPCISISDPNECMEQGCVAAPWVGGSKSSACFDAELMCANIVVESCTKNDLCAVRSNTYCSLGVPQGVGPTVKPEAHCAPFPVWSIALIVVWLLIMIILIFIIVLVRKKAAPTVKAVEQDDVVIDSVNADAFSPNSPQGLQRPLVDDRSGDI